MRLDLAAFIDEHPAHAPLFVRANRYFSDIYTVVSSRHAFAGYRLVAMALVVVMVAGVGTTYAAVNALPGDPLYTVKINIAEPVEHAITASNESQAQWDVTLANRRLVEAEKLAATGALTPHTAQIVQTQLAAVTQDLNTNVTVPTPPVPAARTFAPMKRAPTASTISNTSPTQSAAIAQASSVQSDLEASLSAHVQILDVLASTSPSVRNALVPLVATVRAQAASAHVARIAALSELNTNASSTIRVAISHEMHAAESQLNDVSDLVGAASSSSPDADQIALTASSTQEAIDAGRTSLAQGDLKEAFQAFQAMTRGTRTAQIAAQARADFGTKVAIPTIDISDDSTSTDTSQLVSTSTATSTPDRHHGAPLRDLIDLNGN